MQISDKLSKQLLRIVAGILAVISMGVAVLRFYAIDRMGGEAENVINVMRVIFPLSVTGLFGYIAWKGVFPFYKQDDKKGDNKG